MSCLLRHKWDGCQCTRCGKTRKVKSTYDHSWNGCVCEKCSIFRDSGHRYQCGKCITCGKADETKGHAKQSYRMAGSMVEFYCEDCGKTLRACKYSDVLNDTIREIENADKVGCDAPLAEARLDWLNANRPK